MLYSENRILCESCGAEITCGAYMINDHVFCCKQCYEGYPCACGERMELEMERRAGQSTNSYSFD